MPASGRPCFEVQDRTRILDSQEIHSHLPRAVEEAITFVRRNSLRRVQVTGVRNEVIPEVPLVALREAIVNSVVHADYSQTGTPLRVAVFSDRVEIENPGGLPPGLTLEEVRKGASKLRNRVIGRVFHELGLIEQWGSGIQRMAKACKEAGLPEPILEEVGAGFKVTLGLTPTKEFEISALDQKILGLLESRGGMSTSQIAKEIKRSTRTARERIKRLIGRGLVTEFASSAKDPGKLFRRNGSA